MSQRLGVSQHSLYEWKKKFGVSNGKANEIRRLKKEVARVTEERDILKKTITGFGPPVRGRKVRSGSALERYRWNKREVIGTVVAAEEIPTFGPGIRVQWPGEQVDRALQDANLFDLAVEGKMKPTPEIENALDRFALEQDITREEAIAVIARVWLIGQGYLRGEEDEPAQI